MPEGYTMVTTIDGLEQVLDAVGENAAALDFETSSFTPDTGRVRLCQICNDDVWAVIDFYAIGREAGVGKEGFREFAHWFDEGAWIVFNAGFEQRWFRDATDEPITCWDVANLIKAIEGGGHFSLAKRLLWDLEHEMDKEQQASNWDQEPLTEEQLVYAGDDALWTWKLWQHWRAKADDRHMDAFNLLNDLVIPVIEMETHGLVLDPDKHQRLTDSWVELMNDRVDQVREYITEEEVPNLNSGTQLSDFFMGVIPDEFVDAWPKTEKTGLLSTANKDLKMIGAALFGGTPFQEALHLLAEYKTLQKYVSSFGESLITKANMHPESRVEARYNIAAAKTGRFSSCIPAHVLVDTPTGQRPMGEVYVGDEVISHLHRAQRVTAKMYSGTCPTYRISLSSGDAVECTANHRLLTDHGWMALEDILHETTLNWLTEGSGRRSLYGGDQAYHEGDRIPTRGLGEAGAQGACKDLTGRTACRGGEAAVLPIKAGGVEPYARKVRQPASQFQGGLCRSQRLPHSGSSSVDENLRTTGIPAPCRDVQGAGFTGDPSGVSCPPHQRRQDRQSIGEFSPRVRVGTCGNTPSYSEIRGIEFVGAVPVYDLEVETDHTFIAGGVHVHNSSPNLQQIPRDRDFFGEYMSVRQSFVAPEGRQLVSLDYSGIELRVLALLTGDDQLLEDMVTGDVHLEVGSYMAGRRLDKKIREDKEIRSQAKGVSFGIIYGSSALGLSATLKSTIDRAQELMDFWEGRYPRAFKLRHEALADAQAHDGYLRMIDGGTIWMGKPAKVSITQCANYPVQRSALSVMARAITRHHESVLDARDAGHDIFMASTIHDALIDETSDEAAPLALQLMKRDMVEGYLDIFPDAPTERLVEGGAGPNWGELEDVEV